MAAQVTGTLPLNYPFISSAPGKVIVSGEHAVVHGQPALAAAISLRSYLFVGLDSSETATVTLSFPVIKLSHSWDINSLPWEVFKESRERHLTERSAPATVDPALWAAIEPHIVSVSPNVSNSELKQMHHKAAGAFLFMALSLLGPRLHSCRYILRSTIPIASGLGSSASISACFSNAMLTQAGVIESKHSNEDYINHWAFVGELCMNANSSGIDNTVTTKGHAVRFQRHFDSSVPSNITPIHDFPHFNLLIIDTLQQRSTAVEVSKVGELKKMMPAIVEPILEAIGSISNEIMGMISERDFEKRPQSAHDKFGKLISMNHALLASLGVSHPRIERVCQNADAASIGASKLTGAGGGGCVIIVLRDGVSDAAVHDFEQRLCQEGFLALKTDLGARGVSQLKIWTQPETWGKEITADAFLAADSRPKLDALLYKIDEKSWSYWDELGSG